MPTIVLFLIAPLGLPQVQERRVEIPLIEAPKPPPLLNDLLNSSNWNDFSAGLRRIRRSNDFPSEWLREAASSPDPQIRANALLAWVMEGYQFEKPAAGMGYYTVDDQPLWNVLMENVRSDRYSMNCVWAGHLLYENFAAARPAIELGLRQGDWQMKEFTTRLFIYKAYNERLPALNELILSYMDSYSGNRNEGVWPRHFSRFWSSPHQRWLVHHGFYFYDILRYWLLGEDMERRAIAAHVFAYHRWEGYDQQVVETLVPHLSDDHRPGNGNIAAKALFKLHNRALPYLEKITDFTDPQQETYLRLLVWDIKNPPTNQHELMQRKVVIPSVTLLCTHCFDPLLEHLGWEYYYPEYCDEHDFCGPNSHPFWEMKKSACPCGDYDCDIRKQTLLGLRK